MSISRGILISINGMILTLVTKMVRFGNEQTLCISNQSLLIDLIRIDLLSTCRYFTNHFQRIVGLDETLQKVSIFATKWFVTAPFLSSVQPMFIIRTDLLER